MKPAPFWLADLQRAFGDAIRTPLDRSDGTHRARTRAYDDALVRALSVSGNGPPRARLAVYNRQYWFRLFTVLQEEHPLTARLLGYWAFNEFASRFLVAHPPTSFDIHRAADAFADWLTRERVAPHVAEAVQVDAAFRRVLFAPEPAPFHLTPADLGRLAAGRLVPSAGWAVVKERRPLLALRRKIAGDAGEQPVPAPPLGAETYWLLIRIPRGVSEVPLAPRQAQLYELLRESAFTAALGEVEASTPLGERDALNVDAQRWLASSVGLRLWRGIG